MFTVEQASHLTGLSPGQIAAWDRRGVYHRQWGNDSRANRRLYSFRDVVALRTLAALRNEHRVPPGELRRVGVWLSEHRESPWSSLRFSVAGRRISFDDPDSCMLTAGGRLGQGALRFELEPVADEVRERVEAARRRQPEDVGRIVQRRHVVGHAPVLAGTRIPTSAVWSFHEAGYSAEQIIDEYPRLCEEDIKAAIAFEQRRRAS
jgi:uncharacterized protein (DUF433 family)